MGKIKRMHIAHANPPVYYLIFANNNILFYNADPHEYGEIMKLYILMKNHGNNA